MAKFQVVFNGEDPEDEIFDSYEDADEYGVYLQGCQRQGAEILHWSNPGDNPYDEDNFEYAEYEIVEIED